MEIRTIKDKIEGRIKDDPEVLACAPAYVGEEVPDPDEPDELGL